MIRFQVRKPEASQRCSVCGDSRLIGAFVGPKGGIKLQICDNCLYDSFCVLARYAWQLYEEGIDCYGSTE